jgi:biotin transport system substrate-specific component
MLAARFSIQMETTMSNITARQTTFVLADALIAKRSRVTNVALVAGGAVTVAILAQVSVPLWPVPLTGQTLAVIIVGATLGARRGLAALLLYVGLGLSGLPVFADFTGGPLSVLKPSFGYIIGFIVTAYVVGLLAEKNWDKKFWAALGGFLLASFIPYAFGLPYLAIVLGQLGADNSPTAVIAAGFTPFILGGIVKALIAAAVIPAAWRGVRKLDADKHS